MKIGPTLTISNEVLNVNQYAVMEGVESVFDSSTGTFLRLSDGDKFQNLVHVDTSSIVYYGVDGYEILKSDVGSMTIGNVFTDLDILMPGGYFSMKNYETHLMTSEKLVVKSQGVSVNAQGVAIDSPGFPVSVNASVLLKNGDPLEALKYRSIAVPVQTNTANIEIDGDSIYYIDFEDGRDESNVNITKAVAGKRAQVVIKNRYEGEIWRCMLQSTLYTIKGKSTVYAPDSEVNWVYDLVVVDDGVVIAKEGVL